MRACLPVLSSTACAGDSAESLSALMSICYNCNGTVAPSAPHRRTCAHVRAHTPTRPCTLPEPLYTIGHGHSALERGFRLWYLVGPSGKHAAGGEGEASDEESSDEEGVTDHSALQVQHATS